MVAGSFRVLAVVVTVGVASPACFFPEATKETSTGGGGSSTTASGGMANGGAGGGAAGSGGVGATGGGSSRCTTIDASGDTYLSDNDPTGVYGDSPEVLADSDDGATDKADVALFEFDPRSAGTVSSAIVTLYSTGDTSPDGFTLHPVLERWDEQAATWTLRTDGGDAWSLAGCGEPDSCGAAITDVFTIVEADGAANAIPVPTEVVQAWINEPSSNYGVAMKHSIGEANGVGVWARESPDHAPTLTYCVE